ncbi:DEAD/DEAH box helicase family protein [Bombella sp. TMW 2.2559]|uniref:DEAD/DEAH box helicase family protein n=1 Tax=Bombella dulcis TaxID=2967339 RepID=A0ABT3WFQ1_9PROT|nr:type ISP restriction/modification enzyme [Bombella dulcis]MCX5615716.1 DEAD/DEAH box helicase family protein [Bombella dulcis]
MTATQDNSLKQILKSFETDSTGRQISQRDKGTSFEKLALIYFQNEPKFKRLFSEVLTFGEWVKKYVPDCSGRDTGVDLVGVMRDGSGFEAIQAKFYSSNHTISKKELDSFVTASNRLEFTSRRIVATTGKWGDNAKQTMATVEPCIYLTTITNLENSTVDWSLYLKSGQTKALPKKFPREEQTEAIYKTVQALKEGSVSNPAKGRLLMACGTGKTFTSLRIAEQLGGEGKIVLFLAPSLYLVSQTLTEWTQQASHELSCFAVCSDSEVGKKKDELARVETELDYPATTDASSLYKAISKVRVSADGKEKMIVIFSTYHSSQVIGDAQKLGLPAIDLVICDEAHRTSGATHKDEETKAFQFIHDPNGIARARTLFMTATPRIFSSTALEKAKDADTTLYSMDDEDIYGPIIFEISFAYAVQKERLCPYKIVVLGVSESEVAQAVPGALNNKDNNITLDVASRIIGAWKGLSRQDMRGEDEIRPMHRAVAFCSTIDPSKKRNNSIASRVIETGFSEVVDEYRKRHGGTGAYCEVQHVDGGMNAAEKAARLDWLKEDAPPIIDEETGEEQDVCRILSNVRCLSEGVDVPALDAVVFLAPSNSEVDVVQSVGRVMRRAPGKKRGYIIIPVVVPEGRTADEYFTKGSTTFRTVWMVLQALRAHDSSLDDELDRVNLGGKLDHTKMEVVCVSANAPPRSKSKAQTASDNVNKNLGGKAKEERASEEETENLGQQLVMQYGQREKLADALYARIVQKVGNRNPFARWSKDVKRIVDRHIISITRLLDGQLPLGAGHEEECSLQETSARARKVFDRLKMEIHASINPNVSESEIIEMLGQHLVTGPVFDALFGEDGGHSSNPMTQALNAVTQELYANGLTKEQQGLESFYDSIRARLKDATPESRQALTIQLYDDFFREAFKKQADKLGIVFTPVPVVDFIIRSVEHVLQTQFGCGMGDEKVSVSDPFTGTGSFIARLIDLKQRHADGSEGEYIIPTEKLAAKYKAARKEDAILGKPGLWANELVLLAYYVAGINIATSYTARTGREAPFGGLCLTDTFNLTEHVKTDKTLHDGMGGYLKGNSERILAQESAPIRVIIGNPPYSAGASKAGQAQNDKYEYLDQRIEETYAKSSKSTNKNSLYDSYIRSIRWASDRIGEQGIIGFVTNAGFIEGAASGGLRNKLEEEFSNIWIFHLRGLRGQKTAGERAKKEGGQIFGMGSSAAIAITILVRKKGYTGKGQIHFCDIGDYLTAQEIYSRAGADLDNAPVSDKFHWLHRFASIAGIPDKAPDAGEDTNPDGTFRCWQMLAPDEHGDWLNQRDDSFSAFMTMGSKKGEEGIFSVYSNGLKTQRDAWVWNFSQARIQQSVEGQVATYEAERSRLNAVLPNAKKEARLNELKRSPDFETMALSWTRALQNDVARDKPLSVSEGEVRVGMYRPFTKEVLFFGRRLNEMVYQLPKIFPEAGMANRVICVTGVGNTNPSFFISNVIPDLQVMFNGQCFPLYHYEPIKTKHPEGDMFGSVGETGASRYKKKTAITPEGMAYFRQAWPKAQFDEEDVFYYIYGLLHAPDYRSRYATSLSKELPRIPCVKTEDGFWAFSKAGRELVELHLGYETAEPYFALDDAAHVHIKTRPGLTDEQLYRVEKMAFAKTRNEDDKRIPDHTHLIYNDHIEVTGIPLEAYEYQVNGKSALEWVMDRQQVKTDKRSGITNDPNDWAFSEAKDARWPLLLFLKVLTVSLKTRSILKGLPKFDIVDK